MPTIIPAIVPTIGQGPTGAVKAGPQAQADSASGAENAQVTIDVLANDLGAAAKTLWSLDQSDPAHRTAIGEKVTLASGAQVWFENGQVAYEAGSAWDSLAEGAQAREVFTYAIRLGNGAISFNTVTVTLTGTNDAPVAVADGAAASESGPAIAGSVALNDGDGDSGAVLHYALLEAAPAGLIFAPDGGWTFDPSDPAYQGLADGEVLAIGVQYTVTDEHGACASATLTITLTGTNDAPVAAPDSVAAIEDGAVVAGSVAGNDSDADGDALSFALAAPVAGLTFDTDGGYRFDPSDPAYQGLAAGAAAVITAGYTVSDSHGGSAQSTLTLTVAGANDAPVAAEDRASTHEGDAAIAGTVAANGGDCDDGARLSYALEGSAPAGFTFDSDGNWSFDPADPAYQTLAAGEELLLTVPYIVTDEHGASAGSALTIAVAGANDDPVAVTDAASGGENEILTIDPLANDSDIDTGAELTLVSGVAPAGKGSVSTTGNRLVFDPGRDFDHLALGASEDVILTYAVRDEHGGEATATIVVTVSGANDAPAASSDDAETLELFSRTIDVLANDRDPDDDDSLTLTAVSVPSGKGTVSIVGNQLRFDPGSDFDHLPQGGSESVIVSYTVEDEHGAQSTSFVEVVVGGFNNGPVAVHDVATTIESQSVSIDVLGNDRDVDDGHSLSVVLASGSDGTHGVPPGKGSAAVIDNAIVFDPGTDFEHLAEGMTETVNFYYTIADEFGRETQADVTVTITGANDAPVARTDSAAASERGATIAGSVAVNDSDVDIGAVLHYALTDAAPAGLTMASDGSWTFDPSDPAYRGLAQDELLEIAVPYSVTDEHDASAPSTLTIALSGTNDAPSAAADSATATEGGAVVVGSVALNDGDADGDVLSFALSQPVAGLTVNVDGSYSFDPSDPAYDSLAAGAVQTVTANYSARDGYGAAAASTLTLTVTGSNDAPVTVALSNSSVAENLAGGLVGTLAASDPDAGDTLTYSLVGTAASRFTIQGNELRVGAVGLDFEGQSSYSVTVRATDRAGAWTEQAFEIAVLDRVETILTTSADSFAGSAADDQVIGNALTLTSNDQLSGGGGEDALLLYGAGVFNLQPSTLGFTDFEEIRLINFTGGEASLHVKPTSDPISIIGTGSGRELIYVGNSTSSTGLVTVDLSGNTAGSNSVYAGAGPVAITTGQGYGAWVSLGSGEATVSFVNAYGASIQLGTGRATVVGSTQTDYIYAYSWNAANIIDGGAGTDFLLMGTSLDLTGGQASAIEVLYFYNSGLTVRVSDAALADVTTIATASSSYVATITTADASLDLGGIAVGGGVSVTSSNADGTWFTVSSAQTALSVIGGNGHDTLEAAGFELSASERQIIFAISSVEEIISAGVSYTSPDDPSVIKLTAGQDTVASGAPDSVTVNGTATTLTGTDQLTGGATGTDVLALYGAGTFNLQPSTLGFSGFEEIRLVNFAGADATLFVKPTSDPISIIGTGTGRGLIYLTSSTSATGLVTVDLSGSTASSNYVNAGAGPVAITTGSGSDTTIQLGTGQATVITGNSSYGYIYLNTGQATVIGGTQSDYVYANNWNAANNIDAGEGTDYLYIGTSLDLTEGQVGDVEVLYFYNGGLTVKVNDAALADVTTIYNAYSGYSGTLTTADASLDLSGIAVGGGVSVTSSNADGTWFTASSAQTALSVIGGNGHDTLEAAGFELSASERQIIFAISSVEEIISAGVSYTSPDDPSVIKLTAGQDTVASGAPDSVTVNGTATTLTGTDQLTGGATGTDVLALYGAGTFNLQPSTLGFSGFEEIRLVNFAGADATLFVKPTSDPISIIGTGTGRGLIYLTSSTSATGLVTVDLSGSTASSNYVNAGAGPVAITTGSGSDTTIQLGTGQATVITGNSSYGYIYLNTGQATVIGGTQSDYVYANNWNAANNIDAGEGTDYLYIGTSLDLTEGQVGDVEVLYFYNGGLTVKVNDAALADVTTIYNAYSGYSGTLTTADASLDLSGIAVGGGVSVTSSNADGTWYTVSSAQTALSVIGGVGYDTVEAVGFDFTADQRAAILNGGLVEAVIDSTGAYDAGGLISTQQYSGEISVLYVSEGVGLADGAPGGSDPWVETGTDGNDFASTSFASDIAMGAPLSDLPFSEGITVLG